MSGYCGTVLGVFFCYRVVPNLHFLMKSSLKIHLYPWIVCEEDPKKIGKKFWNNFILQHCGFSKQRKKPLKQKDFDGDSFVISVNVSLNSEVVRIWNLQAFPGQRKHLSSIISVLAKITMRCGVLHGERTALRGQPKGSLLYWRLCRLAANSCIPGTPALLPLLTATFPCKACSDSLGLLCTSSGSRRDHGEGTEQRFCARVISCILLEKCLFLHLHVYLHQNRCNRRVEGAALSLGLNNI